MEKLSEEPRVKTTATSALWQHTSVTAPRDLQIWTGIPTASERGPNLRFNNPRVVAVGPGIN